MTTVAHHQLLPEALGAEAGPSLRSDEDESGPVQPSSSGRETNDVESSLANHEPASEDIKRRDDEDEEKGPLEKTQTAASGKPYSTFTSWEKKFIVLTATLAAFFSPLSAQIYFPALSTMAKDLNVSASKINLTMTTYMILQATAPAFVGGFADTARRRPAYIICSTIYIAACAALSFQNTYVGLLVLRMVQSAGSSGTVALANAVTADVATSAERGTYVAITSLATILAPSIGPILGGVLSQDAGWHWIFGVLTILALVFFIPLLLFFPETCRKIVGDGSIPPPKWNLSLMNYYNDKKRAQQGIAPDYAERDALARDRRIRFPNPVATLAIVCEKEGALILFYAGMVYAGFYCVLSGMSKLLNEIYGYNDTIVGLMFLPLCGGSLVAAFTQGRIMDWNYRRHAARLGIEVKKGREQNLRDFPIESARLQIAVPMTIFAAVSVIGYGWVLDARVSIAGPIVFLFLAGYGLIASSQSTSVLMVDINPGQAGAATAGYNLVRCLLGAGATALTVPLLDALGIGWNYTFVGLCIIGLSPMLFAVMRWGPRWRKTRVERQEVKEALKNESKMAREGSASKVS
ncbi:hypothetical protein BP5796_10943 [Coleophoma crateriformis]|uniref:Major facilitator superfamily (MFS) profile domain-containing protein n=1 Tax=Coleophoma crateriformis TaxID=565419 RepID=A0A3D8QLQ6_9HELO|nr:hypothetical protein BP5796_10943 [Coleophoma crateriformis]